MLTKILVLDSTEGIADMLNFSRTADYDVYAATNAKDAIKIIGESKPQLLVCDINIPDMDGIEFLCHVKKHHPATEVVMISDINHMDIGFKSLKYEASDFIVKPVTNNSLEIVLERAKRKLAIRKKLVPASINNIDQLKELSIGRLSIAKQIVTSLSTSQKSNNPLISGIISLHSPNGIVLEASDEYLNLIGPMAGKNSWGMYLGEAFSKKKCPCSIAVKTQNNHFQKAILKTRDNEEIGVEVFATPLKNTHGKIDLVLEIINLI